MNSKIFLTFFIIFVSLVPDFLAQPLRLFTADGRSAYFSDEKIEFGLISGEKLSGELSVTIQEAETNSQILLRRQQVNLRPGETLLWTMPANLRPANYDLQAKVGDSQSQLPLRIVPSVPDSHFPVGFTDSPSEVVKHGGNLGYTHIYPYTKIDGEGRFVPDPLPLHGIERFFEECVRNGIFALNYSMWSGYVLHQPFESMASWNDPEIARTAQQAAVLGAQRLRRFPRIVWNCPMDEPGLGYGLAPNGQLCPLFPDEFQRAEFTKATGIQVPADPRELSPDDFASYIRWRNGIIGRFMQEAREHYKRVLGAPPWTPDIYAGWVINDGAYPTNAFSSDFQNTHAFWGFSYPVQGLVADLALERGGKRGSRLSFALNGWLVRPPIIKETYDYLLNLLLSSGVDILWWLNYGDSSLLDGVLNRTRNFGDFFRSLREPRHSTAILFSVSELAQRLRESKALNPGEIYNICHRYRNEIGCFYMACSRAGFPADILLEEELQKGELKGRKALWLIGLRHKLPEKVMSQLEKFQKAGGKILMDTTTTIRIPGAIQTGIEYASYNKLSQALDNRIERLLEMKQWLEFSQAEMLLNRDVIVDEKVPKVAELLRRVGVVPEAILSDARLLVNSALCGEGKYLFLINNSQKVPETPTAEFQTPEKEMVKVFPILNWVRLMDAELLLTNLREGAAIYAIEGREWQRARMLIPSREGKLRLSFEPCEMKVLCVLPGRIQGVKIFAPRVVEAGNKLRIHASVIIQPQRRRLKAAVPLIVVLRGPTGTERYRLFRSTDFTGLYQETLPIAANDLPGNWTLIIKERLSGKAAKQRVKVKSGVPLRLVPIPIVQTFDETAICSLLRSGRKLKVVVGGDISLEERNVAQALEQTLNAKGLKVELVEEKEILRKGRYPKVFPAYEKKDDKFVALTMEEREKRRKEWKRLIDWVGNNGYPPGLPDAYEAEGNLILIGTDTSSILIQALQRGAILPRVANDYYPGKGRGLLLYAWAPFHLNYDVILLTGSDVAGVKQASKRLLELLEAKRDGR